MASRFAMLAGLAVLVASPLPGHAAAGRHRVQAAIPPGVDVDGDGAADFINPTGLGLRGVDGFGSGAFLASRDEGARLHRGADFVAAAGQRVNAPMSGYVTKIGYPYGDDLSLRYVELTNRAIGYVVRIFYVQPGVTLGQALRQGDMIGVSQSLQRRYPAITDHVHVELTDLAYGHVDPAKFIPTPGPAGPD